MSHTGHNVNPDSKSKNPIQQERPASPVPDCVSMKSNRSMDPPISFGEEAVSPEQSSSSDIPQKSMNQMECPDTEKSQLTVICQEMKSNLMKKELYLFEGIAEQGNSTLLNTIHTELCITVGGSEEVNNEHEVRQIEKTTRKQTRPETAIKCNDIFKPIPGQDKYIRTVLTKGVAGIGKTVSVQKFNLDWAEGKANQDVQYLFSLPFRELNMMKGKEVSLIQLINHFSTETKTAGISNYTNNKVLFIFDGLDECRLPLDFKNNKTCCDVTESTSVDILLTNLIRGNLLPSALLWITTRPAAANQIPSECVDQVTEVRGFNDPQKEEYFRKRFSDEDLASRIISHIKKSSSLHIMCHIPVFCWIAATVLEYMLTKDDKVELPKTITDMYSHFFVFQSTQMNVKYYGKTKGDAHWNAETILTLGKLAFQQLQKGNLIFYEEDLNDCGIDINKASVYSGVCTQIFRTEYLLHEKVFCFVHLSIQEFLAAVYVFFLFINKNENIMEEQQLTDRNIPKQFEGQVKLYKTAVDKTLQSATGHLDLFLRFLLGLSLESNQKHLKDLLTKTSSSSQSHEETVKYIKEKIKENSTSDRCINLFHCLNELNDHSLVEEIKSFLISDKIFQTELSSAQWSALAFMLLTSEQEMDAFDMKKYSKTEEGLLEMLPVIKTCRVILLSECRIPEEFFGPLVSALKSNPSHLEELDLRNNQAVDSGGDLLASLVQDPQCRLATLRLSTFQVTDKGCAPLISALKSNPSHMKELDLCGYVLKGSDVKIISAVLEDPKGRMETLRLSDCQITHDGCGSLASALKSNPSHLKNLDLSGNDLGNVGVQMLVPGLVDPNCKLETLRLSFCGVTEESCGFLAAALNSSHWI